MNIKDATFSILALIMALAIFTFNFIPSAYSQAPGGKAAPAKITDIKVEGNAVVSASTILSKLKIRVGDNFSQKAVNEDIKRVYAMGFFTDVAAEVEDHEDGIRLIFSVTEKSVIEEIVFKGNKAYRQDALMKQIDTKAGDVLNRRRLAEDLKKLKDFYKKKGFPLIKADYKVDINTETNKADVSININEEVKYRIREVAFKGNNSYSDKRLSKIITTRPDRLFTSGFLDENALQQDMERIQEFYRSEGFIDVKASNVVDYNEEDERIYITITVEEGDKYFVGDVGIRGNTVISEETIRKDLALTRGEPYNPGNLRGDVIKIQTLYFDEGYMSCRVKPDTALDKASKSIDITFNIEEGNLIYVREVKVTGNTKTKDVVIRREMRLYPGDKFDGKKLRKSKQRLYDLGFFDEVIFETKPAATADNRDLVVQVKEAKTGELSFGGGYSSVDRLIGFVEIMQKNFDISNYPTFTGAGQNLKVRAEIGSVSQNFFISFTEPWMFGYPYLFGFDLFNFERKREEALGYGYNEKRTGGDLRFGKEFNDFDRADLMYKLERVEISDVSSDATSALREEEGKNDISSLTLTLTRNTTDSKFNPTEGYILSLTGEDAGGILAGDKDYYKFIGKATRYFNYNKKLVFELSARAGWADEYDDSQSVPIYERFFAGGANTVRGYKERSIGPRDDKTGDPIGGESMLIGNAEATYPVFKNFKIAFFYDVGNVWQDSGDLASGGYKSGVGTGVRVKTPIGPVKVDAGFPLDEAHEGDKKKMRLHFSMTRGF